MVPDGVGLGPVPHDDLVHTLTVYAFEVSRYLCFLVHWCLGKTDDKFLLDFRCKDVIDPLVAFFFLLAAFEYIENLLPA